MIIQHEKIKLRRAICPSPMEQGDELHLLSRPSESRLRGPKFSIRSILGGGSVSRHNREEHPIDLGDKQSEKSHAGARPRRLQRTEKAIPTTARDREFKISLTGLIQVENAGGIGLHRLFRARWRWATRSDQIFKAGCPHGNGGWRARCSANHGCAPPQRTGRGKETGTRWRDEQRGKRFWGRPSPINRCARRRPARGRRQSEVEPAETRDNEAALRCSVWRVILSNRWERSSRPLGSPSCVSDSYRKPQKLCPSAAGEAKEGKGLAGEPPRVT